MHIKKRVQAICLALAVIREVNGRPELGPINGHVSIVPIGGSCETGVVHFELDGAFSAVW